MKTVEDIWLEYHNKLSNFIRAKVADNMAEDILQEVFVKIHTRLATLKEDAKLESWLYRITRNTVTDYYRAKRPTATLPDWLDQARSDEDETTRKELASCLVPMIEQLPEKYRVAITLSDIDGKTQKEVAERENISLSGAKSRVQRARVLLRSMLHDCCRIEINGNNRPVSYEPREKSCKLC